MTNPTDIDNAATLIRDLTYSQSVHTVNSPDGDTYRFVYPLPAGYMAHEIDTEQFEDGPRRKIGTAEFDDPESFLHYIALQDEVPNIYCDRDNKRFTAVFDDDESDTPGWRQHRATLKVAFTDDYVSLLAGSDHWFTAADMADWFEEQAHLIADPAWTDLAVLCRKFRATTRLTYSQELDEGNGDVKLVFDRKTTTGGSETIDPPQSIGFVCPVLRGGDPVVISARFRYRAPENEGQRITFSYKLLQTGAAEQAGFDWAANLIGQVPDLTVMYGRPASPRV